MVFLFASGNDWPRIIRRNCLARKLIWISIDALSTTSLSAEQKKLYEGVNAGVFRSELKLLKPPGDILGFSVI